MQYIVLYILQLCIFDCLFYSCRWFVLFPKRRFKSQSSRPVCERLSGCCQNVGCCVGAVSMRQYVLMLLPLPRSITTRSAPVNTSACASPWPTTGCLWAPFQRAKQRSRLWRSSPKSQAGDLHYLYQGPGWGLRRGRPSETPDGLQLGLPDWAGNLSQSGNPGWRPVHKPLF